MAFKKGEHYRCPDPHCGCEMEVVKGAPPTCEGTEKPRCCCGRSMEKVSS